MNMTKAQIAHQIEMLTKMMADAPDTTNEDRWSALIERFNQREKIDTLYEIYHPYNDRDMISHIEFARMYADMMGYTKPKKKGRPAKAKVVKEKQPRKKAVSRIPATLYQQIYFKDGEEFTQTFTKGRTIRHFINERDSTITAKYRKASNDFVDEHNNVYSTLGDAMKRNWELSTGKTIYELNEELKQINRDKNGGKVNHKTLKVGLTVSMYDDKVGFVDSEGLPIGHRDLIESDFEGFGDTQGRQWDNENICNVHNMLWSIEKFIFNKSVCFREEPNKLHNDWIEPKKLTIKKKK